MNVIRELIKKLNAFETKTTGILTQVFRNYYTPEFLLTRLTWEKYYWLESKYFHWLGAKIIATAVLVLICLSSSSLSNKNYVLNFFTDGDIKTTTFSIEYELSIQNH